MKNYKILLPILMVFLMGISVYSAISGASNKKNEYESALDKARKQVKEGLMEDAEVNYMAALDLKDDVTISVELGEAYVTSEWTKTALAWGEELIKKYPDEAEAYEFLLERYLEEGAYEKAFQLQKQADARGTQSNNFKKLMSDIEYQYDMVGGDYDEVSTFCAGMCAVKLENSWGYVNEHGELVLGEQYQNAGCFSSDGIAPIQINDDWYYVSVSGNKKVNTDKIGKCQNLGLSVNGVIGVTVGEESAYYDHEMNKLSESYESVTAITDNMGAVKENGKWYLIDAEYRKIGSDAYAEIKQDGRGLVCMNERCFVRKQDTNKYFLVDTKGKKVGSTTYDDVDIFVEADGYAAVKVGGKWGFIDKNGKVVIKAQYDEARSFSNGYAAVKKNGQWGFIDIKGKLAVEPVFQDAKYFTSSGTAFVQKNGKWTMLELLKLNYE